MYTKIDNYTMEETVTEEKKKRYSLPELLGRKDALRLAIRRIEDEQMILDEKITEAKKLGLKEKFEELI